MQIFVQPIVLPGEVFAILRGLGHPPLYGCISFFRHLTFPTQFLSEKWNTFCYTFPTSHSSDISFFRQFFKNNLMYYKDLNSNSNRHYMKWKFSLTISLKELYTSETTLAQKIVLTPLNNEFRFKNLYLTSFMLKNPPEFLKKIHKNQFSASWRGLMVFIH